MCFLRKNKIENVSFDHKFSVGDFVDFKHRDDLYFGIISNVKLDKDNKVIYDIDIAGQCPTTYKDVLESKVIRIHK